MGSAWLHELVHLMQEIQSAGWVGWLLFVGLYAAACVLCVPGSILTVGAGAVYGFWLGTLLVFIGHGFGSIFCLLITRYLLRGWAAKKFAENPKLHALEDAIREDGWRIVVLARLSPVMPFSLITYALGLTKISAVKFLLGTAVGALPSTCLYVYLGKVIGNLANIGPDLQRHQSLRWSIQGAGLAVTIGVTIYITHLASKALQQRIGKKK